MKCTYALENLFTILIERPFESLRLEYLFHFVLYVASGKASMDNTVELDDLFIFFSAVPMHT